MNRKLTLLFVLVLMPFLLLAQGRIKGKVTDLQTGEPLIGANVLIVGTSFGGATDVNGDYVILNLDAGAYEVRASYIGYQSITVSNVRVNEDLTTELNFELPAEGIIVQEVEVIAERPLINKSNTNANRIVTSDYIDALPVRGFNNILALIPGVNVQDNTIFVRGGRQDEVGYYLEGQNITDPMVGGRQITLVQNAVEEIQVQSGGYNAEFGGANSGIIRQQIRSGTANYKGTLEYATDNIFRGTEYKYGADEVLGSRWYGYNELTATVSGPIVDPRFKIFAMFNYNYIRDQNPQPFPGINLGKIGDPVTGDTVDFSYPAGAVYKNSRENYTGTGSITLDLNPIILRLVGTYTNSGFFNPFSARNSGHIANMLNTARTEQLDRDDGAFSLKATHIITPDIFYEISGGYSFSTQDRYDPILKDNVFAYGDSAANANAGVPWTSGGNKIPYSFASTQNIFTFAFYDPGAVLSAYQKYRRENINITGALSAIVGREHTFKIGGEFQLYTIRNYSFGSEAAFALAGRLRGLTDQAAKEQEIINSGVNNFGYDVFGNIYDGDDPVYKAHKPIFAAGYIQDKIEYNDLILNVGVRFDYIDVDNYTFIDKTRPELNINYSTGEIYQGQLQKVPEFTAVSPRLGFSFPVTDKTVFHAQFGKFVQQTRLRDIYQGLYATGENLQGGLEITAPVGFDVRPTRTTQYEVGFTQQIGEFASFDITGFYKDILDQVVFDKVTVNTSSPFKNYNILTNGDFATTKGVEIAFNMRRLERLMINGSVTFQDAQGTGSFPNSARGIVGAPIDGVTIFKPEYVSPLEYNNSFRGNVNIDYRFGIGDSPSFLEQFGVSALITFTSGHPFTIGIGGPDLEGDARDRQPVEPLNSSTTPWTFQVDLSIDKGFTLFETINADIYLYVINLFDTKNIENVFLRTGSTTDDGYLNNPTQGGQLVEQYGEDYAKLYRAINIDYYEQWRIASTTAPYTTNPFFYGPPRQVRLGVRIEY